MDAKTSAALLVLQEFIIKSKVAPVLEIPLIEALNTVQDAIKDRDSWMSMACYFGDCHAATAEGLTKSSPASAKRRFTSICTNFSQSLEYGELCGTLTRPGGEEYRQKVIERLLSGKKHIEQL